MGERERKAYEDALVKIRLKAKANEPRDPVALTRFQMEQEACARISARKFDGFWEAAAVAEDEEEPSSPPGSPSTPPGSEP